MFRDTSHHVKYSAKRRHGLLGVAIVFAAAAILPLGIVPSRATAAGTTAYYNDFESGLSGWSGGGAITQTATGANGISSASGTYHAVVTGTPGPNTNFGGFGSAWPGDWSTSIDVYLDPSWGAGSGFVYSVASNNTAGTFLQDFAFHAGVLNDASTGSVDKLIVIASNQTVSPGNPLDEIQRTPASQRGEVISAGWYTVAHTFRNINGRLAVVITLSDSSGGQVFSRDVSSDFVDNRIPENVGGNRYGWFKDVAVPNDLAIDNVSRTVSSNEYSLQSDATAPAVVTLDDNQTMTILGVTGGIVTTPVDVTVTSASNGTQVTVPAGTVITAADSSWDGTLNAPVIQAIDSVSADGEATAVSFAVKVGADTPLTFSQPVKVVLPGQAGQSAGYIDAADVFHAISTECGDNPAATITGAVNECYSNEGNNLVIWINHFTTFVAYGDEAAAEVGAPNTGLKPQSTTVLVAAAVVGVVLALAAVAPIRQRVYAKISSSQKK